MQRKPRAVRPVREKKCAACGSLFLAKQLVDGKIRSLYRRSFCLGCSPFGAHNSSKEPPGSDPEEAVRVRKRRRLASQLRYQAKKHRSLKVRFVEIKGGACEECGYSRHLPALEFHHRTGLDKTFALSDSNWSWSRAAAEIGKCVLVCANCHRSRHAAERQATAAPVVAFRRRMKARAVAELGGRCLACGFLGPNAVFDFHHRDPRLKSFGISENGIPRPWTKIRNELAKCVMLCANCHREVHAGIRALPPVSDAEIAPPGPSPPLRFRREERSGSVSAGPAMELWASQGPGWPAMAMQQRRARCSVAAHLGTTP